DTDELDYDEPFPDDEDVLDEEAAPEEPAQPVQQTFAEPQEDAEPAYIYPPLELLNHSAGGSIDATEEMRLNSERLADTLRSFGIQPNIVNVTRGPTVTRYELQLNPGVKLSRITNLSEDIALALGATGVRISAIPEKMSVVGIEVPNRAVSTVYARDVIDSREFSANKSKLAFAVGKDIGGNRIIGNIAKMPHLLIAGTTGSGKSVCMNSLIISLLYKASPDEVRMIMIDPKMVELGIYNNIPHLLIPVVTDPKKASGSLQWAVSEMMRRYSLMAESGAKDIFGYNKAIEGNPERKKLPQIVVVIDELADLMLVAAKEVEESICRIAQMGRASGIHLVIATQRPSANVITGLMKANIPSRIAFAVASAMESRIILDTSGAEKLVGRGDMLYAPLGEGKAKRIQGCFITDEEVHRVADFVKQRGKAEYSAEIMEHIDRKAAQNGKNGGNTVAAEPDPDDDRDELLYDAIDIILELGQASVSVLQRKLKLGYARASRIVDQMEEMGIVGAHKGSKPRDILITKEKWEAVKDGLEHLNEPVPDAID
ncbi:MAG: DNA translocase FtsK, partial [Oscillospiraceae bacterium]|nr:DNA translocase FtsK [Oscillospiraceae bacterium]